MKNILIGIVAICAMSSCSKQSSYEIKGEVADINGKAVLSYENPVSKTKISDTVAIKNGKFVFTGVVEDVTHAEVYILADSGDIAGSRLYIENSLLLLKLDWSSIVDQGRYGKYISSTEITGGVNNTFAKRDEEIKAKVMAQEKYREYNIAQRRIEEYNNTGDYEKYRKAVDEFRIMFADLMKVAQQEQTAASINFIKSNPDVEAAADVFARYSARLTLSQMEDVFNNFTPKVQNCYLASDIKSEIAALKSVQPGAVAPDFTLKRPDGTDFTLSSLRGKYVLIDFWASWCGPCRASVPHLKELYSKYKDKGFEIVGVTNDTDHDDWKKAIEEDQSLWIHVADVFPEKHRGAEVIRKYAAHYLPSLYLIDKEGKMIAKIGHTELDAKLKELLGE